VTTALAFGSSCLSLAYTLGKGQKIKEKKRGKERGEEKKKKGTATGGRCIGCLVFSFVLWAIVYRGPGMKRDQGGKGKKGRRVHAFRNRVRADLHLVLIGTGTKTQPRLEEGEREGKCVLLSGSSDLPRLTPRDRLGNERGGGREKGEASLRLFCCSIASLPI